MTVLLILLLLFLGGFLLLRGLWPDEAPPVTDEEWEECQAYLQEFDDRRAAGKPKHRIP